MRLMKRIKRMVNNSQPIALFDMDGTLADFFGVLEDDLRAMMNVPHEEFIMPDFTSNMSKWLDNRVKSIVNSSGWWRRLRKFKLGWDILECANFLGFSLNIVSRGPDDSPNAWQEKWEWCKNNIPYKHTVTITEDKSLIFGDVLVDDYYLYAEEWLKRHQDGTVIMPVNCYHRTLKDDRVTVYDGSNLDEVKNKLKGLVM